MRLDHLLSMENVSAVERHAGVFDGEILKERYAVVRFSGTEAEELKPEKRRDERSRSYKRTGSTRSHSEHGS